MICVGDEPLCSLYVVLHHTHAVTVSLQLELRYTSSDTLLARNFGPLSSRSHTLAPTLDLDCSSIEFRTPSKALRCHNVALRGPALTSLDIFLSSLPCTLWIRKTSFGKLYLPLIARNHLNHFFDNCCIVLFRNRFLDLSRDVFSKCPSSLFL